MGGDLGVMVVMVVKVVVIRVVMMVVVLTECNSVMILFVFRKYKCSESKRGFSIREMILTEVSV